MRTAVVLGAMLLMGCQEAREPSTATPYLDAAIRAGEWLESVSVDGDGAAIPDARPGTVAWASLGTGAAGRAVFFAELFAASRDSAFLRSAIAAAETAHGASGATPESYGLYNGLAGIGFALTETALTAGSSELLDHAERTFRRIVDAADLTEHGARWGEPNDVLAGTAGIGLALLYAFEQFGDSAFLGTAIRAGDDLIGVAESSPERGLRWMRGTETAFDLPNFSHGTAGVGFFMARLGAVSGLARFTEAAHDAVAYLDLIADRQQGLLLIPYGVPNEFVTPYDIGWAHGPAGTARLYYELWTETGDSGMRSRAEASAQTVLASGIPGPSRDSTLWVGPFRVDRRFGTSSAAAFLMDWGSAVGDEIYLETARRAVEDILERATESGEGLFWRLPRYGFQGGEGDEVFTGYFYGVAGLGLTLLQQHYTQLGEHPTIRLPDDPFPRRERR